MDRRGGTIKLLANIPEGSEVHSVDERILYANIGEIGVVDLNGDTIWSVNALPDFPTLSNKRFLGMSEKSVYFCLGDKDSNGFLLGLDKYDGSVEESLRDIPACQANSGAIVFDEFVGVWNSSNVSIYPIKEGEPIVSSVELSKDQEAPLIWRNGRDQVSLVFSPELIVESRLFTSPIVVVDDGGDSGGDVGGDSGRDFNYTSAVIGFSVMALAIAILLFGVCWVCLRRARKRDKRKEERLEDPGPLEKRPDMAEREIGARTGNNMMSRWLDGLDGLMGITDQRVKRIQSLSTADQPGEGVEAREVEVRHEHQLDEIKSEVGVWVDGTDSEEGAETVMARPQTVVLLSGVHIGDGENVADVVIEKDEGVATTPAMWPMNPVKTSITASSSDASYHTAKSSFDRTREQEEEDASEGNVSGSSIKSTSTIKTSK
jgi:hypothetical protein